jgi:hypothetical protein
MHGAFTIYYSDLLTEAEHQMQNGVYDMTDGACEPTMMSIKLVFKAVSGFRTNMIQTIYI